MPLALVLLSLLEGRGDNDKAVQYLGGSLVAGRILHAVALQWRWGEGPHVPLRALGTGLTMTSIAGAAVLLALAVRTK